VVYKKKKKITALNITRNQVKYILIFNTY